MEGNVPTVIPKIIPVRDPDPVPSRHPPVHPHLPQIDGFGGGALLLLVAPVRCGKSCLINSLLLGSREMGFYDGQDRFDQVSIISQSIANDITSRFLRKAFDTHDSYDDSIIDGIVERQKSYEKEEQPEIAIVLDDCLGTIKREAKINHLCSRYRHFNIRLLIISSQKFRGSVSPVIRTNATNVIIGSPFPNQKELSAVGEEYGDSFGGIDNWLKIYKMATPNRYDFLHMDFQSQPPRAYHNFEKLIAEGPNIIGQGSSVGDNFKSEEEE